MALYHSHMQKQEVSSKKIIVEGNRALHSLRKDSGKVKGSKWPEMGLQWLKRGRNVIRIGTKTTKKGSKWLESPLGNDHGPKWPKSVSVNRDTALARHSQTRAVVKISWELSLEYIEAGTKQIHRYRSANKNKKWIPLRAMKTFIRKKMGHST